jgi:hypothetical protein
MAIPVLLASTTTRWFGTARIPRALAHVGFDVSLLTPRNLATIAVVLQPRAAAAAVEEAAHRCRRLLR